MIFDQRGENALHVIRRVVPGNRHSRLLAIRVRDSRSALRERYDPEASGLAGYYGVELGRLVVRTGWLCLRVLVDNFVRLHFRNVTVVAAGVGSWSAAAQFTPLACIAR